MTFLSKWKAGHLVAAWGVYWVGLAAWGLGSALPIIWRVTRPEAHGNASANFDGSAIRVTVVEGAATVWRGAIEFRTLVLLMGVPPLVLWALWLWAQRGQRPTATDFLAEGQPTERGVPLPDVMRQRRDEEPDR